MIAALILCFIENKELLRQRRIDNTIAAWYYDIKMQTVV